jgi:hypothetical protein
VPRDITTGSDVMTRQMYGRDQESHAAIGGTSSDPRAWRRYTIPVRPRIAARPSATSGVMRVQ